MTPDDFKNDWYKWLTNQCSHIVLGLAVSVVGVYSNLHWLFTPSLAALTYWAVAEVGLQKAKLWRDGIADTFFVMAGSCVLPAAKADDMTLAGVTAVTAMGLAYGAWRRY